MPSNPLPSSARSALREAAPHEAGLELDALIAEKVFGWVWRLDQDNHGTVRASEVYRVICDPEMWGDAYPLLGLATGTEPMRLDRPHPGQRTPKYSTSIADAWLVVEEMARRGWKVDVQNRYAPTWACHVSFAAPDYRNVFEHKDTAPLAICCAALVASSPTGGTTE